MLHVLLKQFHLEGNVEHKYAEALTSDKDYVIASYAAFEYVIV